jgi:hypothetical protein
MLQSKQSGNSNGIRQIALRTATSDIFTRCYVNGAWGSWKRLVTADELTALAARVTALENK